MSPLALSLAHSPELLDPALRDELENLQIQLQTWSSSVEQPGRTSSAALKAWQPVIGGAAGTSGQGYQTQYGLYTAMGRLVVAHFVVILANKGTMVGAVELQGLPVAASVSPYDTFISTAIRFSSFATNWITLQAMMQPNTTRAALFGSQGAATHNVTPVTAADLTNQSEVRGMLVYFGAQGAGG